MTIDEVKRMFKLVVGSFKVMIKLPGIEIEFNGKELQDIEASSMWLCRLITDTLIRHRIFWQNIAHEFRFETPAQRFKVCSTSLIDTADIIRNACDNPVNKNSETLKVIQILMALESKLRLASVEVVDMERWNNEAMFGADERINDDEHLQMVLDTVVKVRKETLGGWELLVGLIPAGELKSEAEEKLREMRIYDRVVGNEGAAEIELIEG